MYLNVHLRWFECFPAKFIGNLMEQNTGCLSTALLQDGWDQRSHHSVGPGVQLGPNSAVGHGDTPIAGWFIREHPIKMDDWGSRHFRNPPPLWWFNRETCGYHFDIMGISSYPPRFTNIHLDEPHGPRDEALMLHGEQSPHSCSGHGIALEGPATSTEAGSAMARCNYFF